jgi:hypothetical protein
MVAGTTRMHLSSSALLATAATNPKLVPFVIALQVELLQTAFTSLADAVLEELGGWHVLPHALASSAARLDHWVYHGMHGNNTVRRWQTADAATALLAACNVAHSAERHCMAL